MFARLVTMKLKANSAEEFSRLIDNEVLPLLRKQNGFRDEITFIGRERALGISLWDTQEDAVAYKGTGYPEVLKALAKPTDKKTKLAVGGSIARYARRNQVFVRVAPNTFGLAELRQGQKASEPPPDFGDFTKNEPPF